MAITFTPVSGSDFGEFELYTPITFSIDASSDVPTVTCTNIELILDFTYVGITVQNGVPATISGQYGSEVFNHYVHYVSSGSSDKLEIPTIVLMQDVPNYKEVFKIDADIIPSILVTITATATFDDSSTGIATYIYKINNTSSALSNWITDYLANRYEEIV